LTLYIFYSFGTSFPICFSDDKGNAVIGTRYGRLTGMFGANETSICKQDLILQEELNCETSISVREAASQQSLSGGQGFC
jgi:hypothetical protein